MPYGKKRGRSRKKFSRKVSKKKYGVSIGKLASKRIDSLLEKRMQEIARKESKKDLVKLVDRNYYFGQVDTAANCYTGGRRLFYDGLVTQVCEIDRADINQPLNNPDADPDEAKMQEEPDNDGVAQGMLTEPMHGKRLGDTIKIDGFTISIKAFMDRCPNELWPRDLPGANPDEVGTNAWHQWFTRQANGSYTRTLPESVYVRWALVRVYDRNAQTAPIIAPVPPVSALCPFRPWGYTAALDRELATDTLWTKKVTLASGKFAFRAGDIHNKDKTINIRRFFKNPLTVQYLAEDQNGQQLVNSRFFFVMRSNIPQLTTTQLVDYSPFAPKVMVMFKTHYHE